MSYVYIYIYAYVYVYLLGCLAASLVPRLTGSLARGLFDKAARTAWLSAWHGCLHCTAAWLARLHGCLRGMHGCMAAWLHGRMAAWLLDVSQRELSIMCIYGTPNVYNVQLCLVCK